MFVGNSPFKSLLIYAPSLFAGTTFHFPPADPAQGTLPSFDDI